MERDGGSASAVAQSITTTIRDIPEGLLWCSIPSFMLYFQGKRVAVVPASGLAGRNPGRLGCSVSGWMFHEGPC